MPRRGLYRREPSSDKSVGHWSKVPLTAALEAEGIEHGRVHALGKDLYIFSAHGTTAKLTVAGCAGP